MKRKQTTTTPCPTVVTTVKRESKAAVLYTDSNSDDNNILAPAGPAMLVSPVSPTGEGPLAKRLRMALLDNPFQHRHSEEREAEPTKPAEAATVIPESSPVPVCDDTLPSPASSPLPPSDGNSTPVARGSAEGATVFNGVCDEKLVELVSAANCTLFPKGLGVAYCAESGVPAFRPRPDTTLTVPTQQQLQQQPAAQPTAQPLYSQPAQPQSQSQSPYAYSSASFFGEASTLALSASPTMPSSSSPSNASSPIAHTAMHSSAVNTSGPALSLAYEPFFSAAPSLSVTAHIDAILAPHTSRLGVKRVPKKPTTPTTTPNTNKPKTTRTRTRRPNRPKQPMQHTQQQQQPQQPQQQTFITQQQQQMRHPAYNPLTRSMPSVASGVVNPSYQSPALGSIAAFISDLIDDTPFCTSSQQAYAAGYAAALSSVSAQAASPPSLLSQNTTFGHQSPSSPPHLPTTPPSHYLPTSSTATIASTPTFTQYYNPAPPYSASLAFPSTAYDMEHGNNSIIHTNQYHHTHHNNADHLTSDPLSSSPPTTLLPPSSSPSPSDADADVNDSMESMSSDGTLGSFDFSKWLTSPATSRLSTSWIDQDPTT
eukprot:TRINITY_DN800_c0_g2_i2.p1 TRINITY_DN800_c0_g2~~TRINITY_DN800_c0_g2_i2.p1  ORF type:complete len:596 (+),score=128.54 TRINITY_DN800_c0_g2_i2:214-2001(+)